MSVLRKVAELTRLDCIRNDEMRQRLQQRSIVEVMKERILNWRAKVSVKPGRYWQERWKKEDLRGDLQRD